MNKNLTYIIIVVVIILNGIYFYVQQKDVKGSTIKIGFIGPLTGDGAVWGEIERNVIELGFNEINKEGGINGQRVELIFEDGKCVGKDAVSAAHKLIEVDKAGILFVSCSQEVIPIAPITEENKIIVFSSYAMSALISSAGDYVFRNSYTNRDIAKTAAGLIIKKHNKLATISEVSEFATDLRDNLRKEFKALGGEIIVEENFFQGSRDIRLQAIKVINSGSLAVFVNPNSPVTGLTVLKQLRELGYGGEIYGNFFGSSKEIQLSDVAQSMIFFADPRAKESSEKKVFMDKYKAKYGDYPDLEYPAVARYDAVKILAGAIEDVGDDPTKIRDHLYSLESFSGLLGEYRFDKNGDVFGIMPAVNIIKNKEAVPYE